MATKAKLKQNSYQNHKVYWQILLAGEDISSYVEEISEIEESLDIPQLTEYTASDASFQLRDFDSSNPEWSFSPERSSNFFTERNYPQTGYKTPLEIRAGFTLDDGIIEAITVFKGELIEITQTVKTGIFQCNASDISQTLRTEDVTNFGLEKSYPLDEGTDTASGNYLFTPPFSPVSKESVSGYLFLGELDLTGAAIGDFKNITGENSAIIVIVQPIVIRAKNPLNPSELRNGVEGQITIEINNNSKERTIVPKNTLAPPNELRIDEPIIYTSETSFDKNTNVSSNITITNTNNLTNKTKIFVYENLKNVQNLDTEGDLDSTDFVMNPEIPSIFQTEGGPITEAENDDRTPNPTFKAPYRYKKVDTIVNDLLTSYENIDRNIEVPEINQPDPYFSSLGRVGYDNLAEVKEFRDNNSNKRNISNEKENELSGFVTDFIYNPDATELYRYDFESRPRGLTEFNDAFYFVTAFKSSKGYNLPYLMEIDPKTGRTIVLGKIKGFDFNFNFLQRPEGLTTFKDELYFLSKIQRSSISVDTRNNLYRLVIIDLQTLNVTDVKITDPVDPLLVEGEKIPVLKQIDGGHLTGLSADDNVLYVSSRQRFHKFEPGPNGFTIRTDLDFNTRPRSSNAFEIYGDRAYFSGCHNGQKYLWESNLEPGSNHQLRPTNLNLTELGAGIQALGTYKGELYALGENLVKINVGDTPTTFTAEPIRVPKFYFLYSSYKGSTKPKLIEYNVPNDKFTTLTQFEPQITGTEPKEKSGENAHADWWKLAYKKEKITETRGMIKNGDDENREDYENYENITEFYILGTVETEDNRIIEDNSLPDIASYDSSEEVLNKPSKVKIWKYDSSGLKVHIDRSKSNGYLPQLAQSYSGHRRYSLPDSRKNFEYFNGNLYYIWANGDIDLTSANPRGAARHTFGIAKVSGGLTTVSSLSHNNRVLLATENIAGSASSCDFVIDTSNNKLYAGFTFRGNTTSTFKIVERSLTDSPEPPIAATVPVFGTNLQTTLYEDIPYDQTITVTGTPTPTITSAVTSGALPGNMTLDGARLYSTGNPQIIADAGTTFSITYTARSSAGTSTQVVNFTIGTNRLPVFDDFAVSNRFLTENVAYSQTVTATGVPTPTITSTYVSGPTGGLSAHGLTLSGATISGTPTSVPDSGFFFVIDFTATSSSGTATLRLAFYVNNAAPSVPANRYTAPSFNTFTPAALTIGTPTNQTITATGNPTPTITSEFLNRKVVKVFFARPSDGTPITNAQETAIRRIVTSSQTFFSDQMNAHGYGRQTFAVETNSGGQIIVNDPGFNHIPSQITDLGSRDFSPFLSEMRSISGQIENQGKVCLFLAYKNLIRIRGFQIGHFETFNPSIMVFVDSDRNTWSQNTVSHEIGHAFGLSHEDAGNDRHNIMFALGKREPARLSAVSAQKLNDSGYLGGGNATSIPTGLTLNGATLSGTPSAGTAGTFSIIFTATSTAGTVKRIVTFTIGT